MKHLLKNFNKEFDGKNLVDTIHVVILIDKIIVFLDFVKVKPSNGKITSTLYLHLYISSIFIPNLQFVDLNICFKLLA